jgi:hypothetical protein
MRWSETIVQKDSDEAEFDAHRRAGLFFRKTFCRSGRLAPTRLVHRAKLLRCSQFRDPPPGREELRVGKERQRIETISRHSGEHRRKFVKVGDSKEAKLQSEQRSDRLDVIPKEGM